MKKIEVAEQKSIALEILIFFADFCEKHNLKYMIFYGTLLGAVRHNGYIPWDDDIDVVMPRKDYEKLAIIFKDHPYYKFMDNRVDNKYGKLFGVINDKRTIKKEKLRRKKCNDTTGINIDIFPLDFLPDETEERNFIINKTRDMLYKLACLTYSYGKGRTIFSTIKKNIGIVYYRTLDFLHLTSIISIETDFRNLISSFPTPTKTLGCLSEILTSNGKDFFQKQLLDDTIELDFEGYKFRAPKYYHQVLSYIYGDYMELPPVENRVKKHNNICYWK